jgi:hypothetical protein
MKFLKLRLGLRKIKFKLMKPKTKPMVITLSVIFHSGRAVFNRSPWQGTNFTYVFDAYDELDCALKARESMKYLISSGAQIKVLDIRDMTEKEIAEHQLRVDHLKASNDILFKRNRNTSTH